MKEKNQTVAFEQSNLDDLKEIAGRLTSCRVMLELINGEVKAAMPVEYETHKAIDGVVCMMSDVSEWLTSVVYHAEAGKKVAV